MSTWRQIGGDMTWEKYGLVLGKDEPEGKQVLLVRIVPWLEHEKEAAVSQGLYLVDEKTVDYDDLGLERRTVREALRSAGIESAEWDELAPEYRAEILASHEGYEESRSVNKLAEALPAPPEEIQFHGQKETAETLESYDDEARREALEANFETRFSFGEMPPGDAIAFALGDDEFEMDLRGQDLLAFEYGTSTAGVDGDTSSAENFIATVRALGDTPSPAALAEGVLDRRTEEILAEWEERYGDPSDEEDGIASGARRVASDMLAALGFEWV